MKRSEMLYSIQREIELRSDRFGNLTESPSKLALSILDELEELGMLPPLRKSTPDDFLNTGFTQDFLDEHEFESNKWEEENEKK